MLDAPRLNDQNYFDELMHSKDLTVIIKFYRLENVSTEEGN